MGINEEAEGETKERMDCERAAMSVERPRFRAGDVVRHGAETYTLACDESEDGVMRPAGRPNLPITLGECELVAASDDEKRLDQLRSTAEGAGFRSYLARQQLRTARR